jgi:hypothetical protein
MIFRALFWIAIVAVLMPKEPDLGLGRPGMNGSTSLVSRITAMVGAGQSTCKTDPISCIGAAGMVGQVSALTGRTLADVKAELDQAKRDRAARHHG